MRLGVYLGGSFINSSHAVEPEQFEPGLSADEQAREHVLEFRLFDLNLHFEGMLTERFGWALRIPIRTVEITADFHGEHGEDLESFNSIHHRNERLVGLSDVSFYGIYTRRWSDDDGRSWLNLRLGFDTPTGNIEPDPFTLGANGLPHQHVFFGSGTFDPIADISWGHQWGQTVVSVSGTANTGLYENKYGYRTGTNLASALGVGYRPEKKWSVVGTSEFFHETPSTWSGRPARNSGRTGVSLGLQVSGEVNQDSSVSLAIERPFILENKEGSLEIPLILRLGYVQQWRGEVKAPQKR